MPLILRLALIAQTNISVDLNQKHLFATRTPAAKDAAKSLSMSSQKLFIRRRRQLFRLPISLSILPPPPYRSNVIVSPQVNRCCLGTESGGRASTQPALSSNEKRGASSPHLGNKGNGKNTQTQERRKGTDESCFSKPDVVGAQASEITVAKRVEGGRLLFALFKYFFVTWMPLKWDRKKQHFRSGAQHFPRSPAKATVKCVRKGKLRGHI